MKLTTMIQVLVLSLSMTASAEARRGFAPVVAPVVPRCAPVVAAPAFAQVPVVLYDAYGRPVIVQQQVLVTQPAFGTRRGYGRRYNSRRWWR